MIPYPRLRPLRIPSAFRGVRGRLTLWYVAMLAVVLVLSGGAVYTIEGQSLTAALDARLHTLAQQLAATYDARHDQLLAAPDAATRNGDEIVLLLTLQGRIVQRQAAGTLTAKAPWSLVSRDLRVTALNGGQVVEEVLMVALPSTETKGGGIQTTVKPGLFRFTGVPLREGSRVVALLVVGLSSDVPRQLAALARALELTIPLALLMCAAGGYWLADRALRPVRRIARTAREIGATDLSRRLGLRPGDELGDLAATIDGMLDRLQAAFRRQRQFTDDAGHELRTPLAIIDLEATRILDRPRTLEEYQRAIAAMRHEATHLARLVDGLLILARADSGQPALAWEEIDLAEIALDVVERLTPLARRSGMNLILAPLDELPLRGDRVYVTQMVMNLVENGLKHGAGVGTRVCIEGGCRREKDTDGIWLRVVDDGPGIAPEHLPHLAERFYRADRARTHNAGARQDDQAGGLPATGSGLGLAIVHWIARVHGGRLLIESEMGHGATFEVWLPRHGDVPGPG